MKYGKMGVLVLLCLCLMAGAHAETIMLDGRVEANGFLPLFSSIEGYVENVYVQPGERIAGGAPILSVETNKVYAPMDGTVSGILSVQGDMVQGEVLVVEAEYPLIATCTFSKAHKSNETMTVQKGETVYLRCITSDSPRRTGTGIILHETDGGYTVQVTDGNLLANDNVQVYRQENFNYASCIGSGQVAFAAKGRVTASGMLLALHVKNGQVVEKGDLLLETLVVEENPQLTPSSDLTVAEECIVAELNVSIGQSITLGQQVATVIPVKDVCVKVMAEEADLALLPVGQEVTISLNALPAKEYPGKVESISYLPEDASARVMLYEVTIRFPADEDVRLMMGATVEIERDGEACSSEESR